MRASIENAQLPTGQNVRAEHSDGQQHLCGSGQPTAARRPKLERARGAGGHRIVQWPFGGVGNVFTYLKKVILLWLKAHSAETHFLTSQSLVRVLRSLGTHFSY